MIDTIVLRLPETFFQIHDPDKFIPSARCLDKQLPGTKSKQNPLKRELRSGIYKPHLTLSYQVNLYGYRELVLKVELSLPKLIFGNNFEELQYKHLKQTVAKLVAILHQMGVTTTAEHIANAAVSAIHYSKNIPLTDPLPLHKQSELSTG